MALTAAALGLVAGACGGSDTVALRLEQGAIELPDEVAAGTVTFAVTVASGGPHTLRLCAADTSGTCSSSGAIPLSVTEIAGPRDLAPYQRGPLAQVRLGTTWTATITAHLVPGTYVAACTVPGHDDLEHTTFEVR